MNYDLVSVAAFQDIYVLGVDLDQLSKILPVHSLRNLDLSSNPIRANYPELLTFVQRLTSLR